MRTFAHIVKPVLVPKSSDLYLAQPITFETMRRAKACAEETGKIKVNLYATQYPEDHPVVPEDFIRTPDLERSVLDVAGFEAPNRLPFVGDIIGRLYEAGEADYFIYTNADIALQPFFYKHLDALAEQGFDAFVINRRTVPATEEQAADLKWLYAQKGERHGGYDCFVFRPALLKDVNLHHLCIGTSFIGNTLVGVLSTVAERFAVFRDFYLTFHINNDKVWRNKNVSDYVRFNARQGLQVLTELEARTGPLSEFALSCMPKMRKMLEGKRRWRRKLSAVLFGK